MASPSSNHAYRRRRRGCSRRPGTERPSEIKIPLDGPGGLGCCVAAEFGELSPAPPSPPSSLLLSRGSGDGKTGERRKGKESNERDQSNRGILSFILHIQPNQYNVQSNPIPPWPQHKRKEMLLHGTEGASFCFFMMILRRFTTIPLPQLSRAGGSLSGCVPPAPIGETTASVPRRACSGSLGLAGRASALEGLEDSLIMVFVPLVVGCADVFKLSLNACHLWRRNAKKQQSCESVTHVCRNKGQRKRCRSGKGVKTGQS